MASEKDNPFLRHKKALKGSKMSGGEVHDMLKRKSSVKKKPAAPKMQDLGMAMKKKKKSKKGEPTVGGPNVERKASKKKAKISVKKKSAVVLKDASKKKSA